MKDAGAEINPAVLPEGVGRWNWGAFLLNWIWGVGNGTFIALLTLVPVVGLVMPFVLGAKGDAWAWRNGRWDNVAHFRGVQRSWAIWGVIVWLAVLGLFGGIMGGVFYGLRHSEAYELAAARVRDSAEVADALGTPISTGLPMGRITIDGASGRAVLDFSAAGPKASGRVYVEAFKRGGTWSIERLTVQLDGSETVIKLVVPTKEAIGGRRDRFAILRPANRDA